MVGLPPDSSGFDSPPVHVGTELEFDIHRELSIMDFKVATRRGAASTINQKIARESGFLIANYFAYFSFFNIFASNASILTISAFFI